MKAIGFKKSLAIGETDSFIAFETPKPKAKARDLLVEVEAVSVNPVDYKIRQNAAKEQPLETPRIIGWDAVGTVREVGEEVSLFKMGDRVFYAGDITRPGCNAEYQLVDERIVGRAPQRLSAAEAAAMPLTALTAWETLFDRMNIPVSKKSEKSVLIIGGAGGVGSIAIQLAKKLAGLKVLATASRPESRDWCRELAADYVLDHRNLVDESKKAGFPQVDYIADFVDSNAYWKSMVELIKPQGHIASITGSDEPVVLNQLKSKSASFSWELMYTRSMFKTEDMIEQHHILNKVADLLDRQVLHSTLKSTLKGFTVKNFKEAHLQLESGRSIGKLVITF